MRQMLSRSLLVLGAVLLVLGLMEAESVSASASLLFTGEPTDKAVGLLLGGVLALIAGLAGWTRGRT